jgi:hypothetical protein
MGGAPSRLPLQTSKAKAARPTITHTASVEIAYHANRSGMTFTVQPTALWSMRKIAKTQAATECALSA